MNISLSNFTKGTLLEVSVVNGRLVLDDENHSDITEVVDNETYNNICHIGKALVVVKDSESAFLTYCCNYHTHSHYSLLDGMSKLNEIAIKSDGITAVTDHGNMYNILKWQNAMEKVGKKAIFGTEAYIESYLTREKNRNHLILLAKNETGKKNLFILSSNSFNNFYYKPHISIDDLERYHEGIICTSACLGGELARVILNNYEAAKQVAIFYKNIFKDDYYIEIQRHNIELEDKVNPLLLKLAKELDIKVVCANDSHYLNVNDFKEHEVLLCVNQKKTLSEEHFKFEGNGYHYKSDKEMARDFWDMPDVLANTLEIAKKCTLEIETGTYYMPEYPYPSTFESDDDYLLYLIDKGFKERFVGTDKYNNPEYLSRLEYEKSIILKMGFSSYFLIVWDYVNWAKSNDIAVGPARGSGAGSLCLYCLKITELDPMPYGLLFERFLNPDRISMPDIDVDFDDERRGEVIEYVKEKYGEDRVCNIITFNCLQEKASLKDVSRALFGDQKKGESICKLLNPKANSILESVKGEFSNIELTSIYNTDKDARECIDIASKVAGSPKTTSVHACGVVIAKDSIKNYLPTSITKADENGVSSLVTQVTMSEVEDLGLLKMDFLGLKTLNTIVSAIKMANVKRAKNGLNSIKNYTEIPLTDPYVYKDISKGKSFGVFQIESDGMRSFMRQLFADVSNKIAHIEDKYSLCGYQEISGNGTDYESYHNEMVELGKELFERMIAGVSLYRPGPMDYIPEYLANINNPEKIVYPVKQLESILKETYGIIVYQEEVMAIVKALAGFSNGDSDKVRKGMAKKVSSILDEYKVYFIEGSGDKVDSHTGKKLNIKGCVGNGIRKDVAEELWSKMEDFAKYAFNKSHAAAYSVITMCCAWLKYYYPVEFMTSLANSYLSNNDKLKGYISIAKKMGIEFLLPDCNEAYEKFTTNGNQILFGFMGIKGLSNTVSAIVREREENGLYQNFGDFVLRTYSLGISKDAIESMISCGCFDKFGYSRKALLNSVEMAINLAKRKAKSGTEQFSFFDTLGIEEYNLEIHNMPEMPTGEMLQKEKDCSGLYLSEHPLDYYSDILLSLGATDFISLNSIDEDNFKETGVFVGIINDFRVIYTKKDNSPMAIIELEDRTDSISAVMFPKEYEAYSHLLKKNAMVVIKGQASSGNFGMQIVVSTMLDLKLLPKFTEISYVNIRLNNMSELNALASYVTAFKGNVPVRCQVEEKLYLLNTRVEANSSLFMSLSNRYGVENVKYS